MPEVTHGLVELAVLTQLVWVAKGAPIGITCGAVSCCELQCGAVWCSELQLVGWCSRRGGSMALNFGAGSCSELQ